MVFKVQSILVRDLGRQKYGKLMVVKGSLGKHCTFERTNALFSPQKQHKYAIYTHFFV
jgi:hypothetical protein